MRSVTRTAIGQALALAWSSRLGLGGASARYGDGEEGWTDTVYLGVVPRRVFDAIGLYDESITQDEDTEFNYRLRARGGRILVSPRLQDVLRERSVAGADRAEELPVRRLQGRGVAKASRHAPGATLRAARLRGRPGPRARPRWRSTAPRGCCGSCCGELRRGVSDRDGPDLSTGEASGGPAPSRRPPRHPRELGHGLPGGRAPPSSAGAGGGAHGEAPSHMAEFLERLGHRVIATPSAWWYDVRTRFHLSFPHHRLIDPSPDELSVVFRSLPLGVRYFAPAGGRGTARATPSPATTATTTSAP